jgi:hypothetical protein
MDDLDKQLEAEIKLIKANTVSLLVNELSVKTPVDTGLAASSWEIKLDGENVIVHNDVPYIDYLNHGSSEQAPPYFIEKVALKYGEAKGSVVDYKK